MQVLLRLEHGHLRIRGRRGWDVPGTLVANENGSSKSTVGWPARMAAIKLSHSGGPMAEGWMTTRTSKPSSLSPGLAAGLRRGMGCDGLTGMTSYCFFKSSMICHAGDWPCMLKRPKTGASVSTMPTRFAFLLLDGADRPHQLVFDGRAPVDERQDHFLQAAGHGHGKEDQLGDVGPVDDVADVPRLDAVALLGKVGHGAGPLHGVDLHVHHVAGAGLQLAERAQEVQAGLQIRSRAPWC